MNRDADPCEDFYEYACGGYNENQPVNLNYFYHSKIFSIDTLSMVPRMFNKVVQNPERTCSSELKMAQLYHSCMDEFATLDDDGSLDIKFMNTSLEQVVETVHKWYRDKLGFNIYKSVSHQDQYTGPYHVTMWPNSKLRYRNINFTSPLFMIKKSTQIEANSGMCQYKPYADDDNEIWIGQPEDKKMEFLLPIKESEIKENALDYILDLIYDPFNTHSQDKANLKSNLVETIQTLIDIRNFTEQEATTEQIEFLMQFENLIPEWFKREYEKRPSELRVQLLHGGDYFEQLASSEQIMSPNNFMQLQFISSLTVIIKEIIEKTEEGCRLDEIVNNDRPSCSHHTRDREKFCLYKLYSYYEFALISANAYMKYFTGEQSFHDIEQLTEKIRESILMRIDDSIQNATTKAGMTEYINRIILRPKVDQIECDFTNVLLENLILETDKFTPFSLNILRMWEFYQNKIMTQQNPTIYSIALRPNAYYSAPGQKIRLMTFLIHALYSEQHHTPSQYGSFGSVIAHEFGHALDPVNFPKFYLGALMDPETNATLNAFAKCITDIYTAEGINGSTSLNENYSDIFGMRVVIDTLKREEDIEAIAKELRKSAILYHFSPEQLMFLSFGQNFCEASVNSRKSWNTGQQSHAPSWARVNVALSVIPEFAKAFQCAPDSFMASRQHCKIWP
ncbi:neprilysin-like isoform X3 [Convolutriloba macropyga]